MINNWNELKFWILPVTDFYWGEEDSFLPPPNLRFKALELTPFDKVKVVILGQDPYHTPGVADGLAFSSGKPDYVPPSLANIFKELRADLGIETPGKAALERWAVNGVLLLNTSLTVEANKPNSHQGRWDALIKEIIDELSTNREGIVFILWGNNARTFKSSINSKKHHIIESSHPSPYSAGSGFFGSKPFSRANEYLISKGKEPIDWTL